MDFSGIFIHYMQRNNITSNALLLLLSILGTRMFLNIFVYRIYLRYIISFIFVVTEFNLNFFQQLLKNIIQVRFTYKCLTLVLYSRFVVAYIQILVCDRLYICASQIITRVRTEQSWPLVLTDYNFITFKPQPCLFRPFRVLLLVIIGYIMIG